MRAVTKIVFAPTKWDAEKNRWLLDSSDFVLPEGFTAKQSALVGMGPNGWAADHRHKRREVLLGLSGELYLIWRDETGKRQEASLLRGDGKLQIFVIEPDVPHLVENRSETAAVLYEWADGTDDSVMLDATESLRA